MFQDQCDESVGRCIDVGRCDAAFEAVGAVAGDLEPAARGAHGLLREGRGLDEHIRRAVADGARCATLDPRDGGGHGRIGDHQIARAQGKRLGAFADGYERFAVLGRAHVDGRAGEPRQVEDVRGLPVLEEHVVGGINEDVAGNLADRAQALLHPLGARAHADAADHAGGVERACLVVVVGDRHGACAVENACEVRLLHGSPGHGGKFARQVQVAQAIAAVAREFDLEHDVAIVG